MGLFTSPYFGDVLGKASLFTSPYFGVSTATSPRRTALPVAGCYWAPRYFAKRYWTPKYWNDGTLLSVTPISGVPGVYWAPRYFAGRYWAPRYWPGNASLPIFAGPSPYDRFSQVLLAVQSKIVAGGFYLPTQVAISLKDGPFPLFGSDFCYIKPLERNADQGAANGCGRYVSTFVTRFIVRVFKRLPTDVATLDANRLTNASVGLLSTAYNVLNQLQMYHPVDAANHLLTTEPIRQQNAGVSLKIVENEDPNYLRIDLYFEARIRPPLDILLNQ